MLVGTGFFGVMQCSKIDYGDACGLVFCPNQIPHHCLFSLSSLTDPPHTHTLPLIFPEALLFWGAAIWRRGPTEIVSLKVSAFLGPRLL